MSLIPKPTMTDKNRTAHQRNGRQSRGAATPAGKERNRAAHLRHGFYSQQREEALCAFGEDPAELAALISDTCAEWRPANGFQARVSERLARLLWRMDRAERIQESLAVGQLRQHQQRREEVALALRRETTPRIDILSLLEEGASHPRYYTPRGYFRMFSEAFGKHLHEAEKEILELMHRLRKPQASGPQVGPRSARPVGTPSATPPGAILPSAASAVVPHLLDKQGNPLGEVVPEERAASRTVTVEESAADDLLGDLAEWDDDDFALPWPKIPVAQGPERDELRENLDQLANRLRGAVQEALDAELQPQEAPLTPIDRDELLAAPHRHGQLMRREEESCFRQFMRLGNFLMKIQNHATKQAENEGSSGYIDENTEGPETERGTDCPEPVNASTGDNGPTIGSEVRSPRSEVGKTESEVRSAGSEVGEAESGAQGSRSADGKAEFEVQKPGSEVKKPGFEAEIPETRGREGED